MPHFRYTGPPGSYPMLRDATGLQVGPVTPGDIREFDAAPDPSWTWLDPAERERAEAEQREIAAAITELSGPAPDPPPRPARKTPRDTPDGGQAQDSGDAGTSNSNDEPAGSGSEES